MIEERRNKADVGHALSQTDWCFSINKQTWNQKIFPNYHSCWWCEKIQNYIHYRILRLWNYWPPTIVSANHSSLTVLLCSNGKRSLNFHLFVFVVDDFISRLVWNEVRGKVVCLLFSWITSSQSIDIKTLNLLFYYFTLQVFFYYSTRHKIKCEVEVLLIRFFADKFERYSSGERKQRLLGRSRFTQDSQTFLPSTVCIKERKGIHANLNKTK